MHTSNGGSGVTISQCLDHIIGAVRTKVLEVCLLIRNAVSNTWNKLDNIVTMLDSLSILLLNWD